MKTLLNFIFKPAPRPVPADKAAFDNARQKHDETSTALSNDVDQISAMMKRMIRSASKTKKGSRRYG